MARALIRRVLRGAREFRSPAAGKLVTRAREVREQGHYLAAAILYEEALRLNPGDAPIHVQAGHMFKEAGKFTRAEEHYLQAQALIAEDGDLALQMGHFYKVAGRLNDAAEAYRRAMDLKPGWTEPARELADLRQQLGQVAEVEHAPPVVPVAFERLHLHRLGRIDRGQHGAARTLRGIEALRGYCLSSIPIELVELVIDGTVVMREPPSGPYPPGRKGSAPRKYVFNLWHDFSVYAGRTCRLELRCVGARGVVETHCDTIPIAGPLREIDHPGSDGLVEPDPKDLRSTVDQVNARPSVIRPAQRALMAELPRAVLVQRVDQLGDLVVSVPALQRLRGMLPNAKLVGLLSPANAALGAKLDLFDEIVVASFSEDQVARQRVMSRAAQEDLRARLAPYCFDLAIDLLLDGSSRPLLLLSGAPFLYGFDQRGNPWLTAGADGFTHDRMNGEEVVPHSARLVGLVDWLGAMLGNHANVVRRPDLTRSRLARFGLSGDDRYVVLHTGARLGFNRWPGFAELAELILNRISCKLVVMDDADAPVALPSTLSASDRLIRIDGHLDFDEFDALLSFCAVMVGNDSGPKQLAALRGAKVISLHMARTNWSEWGQEGHGLVISRRVPCAGCAIHHEPEECGKDFACLTRITAAEVFAALISLL